MGRKKSTQGSNIVAFRVPDSVIEELEDLAERADRLVSGVQHSSSEMARAACLRGIEILKTELAPKKR